MFGDRFFGLDNADEKSFIAFVKTVFADALRTFSCSIYEIKRLVNGSNNKGKNLDTITDLVDKTLLSSFSYLL